MIGARRYARLFKTGQYGCFYIVSGTHARGSTFRIQLLPAGDKAFQNGSQNDCLNTNSVLVYGVVSGNPGWTETYGWIKEGPWVKDFESLVKTMELREKEKAVAGKEKAEKLKKEREESERKIMEAYSGGR